MRLPGTGLSFAVLLAVSLVAVSVVHADAIVVTRAMTAATIAEIHVEESVVRVELEIGVADLPAFRDLLPEELHDRLGFDPEPWSRRLARFFGEGLVIRVDEGPPVAGRLISLEGRRRVPRDEITGEPLSSDPESGEPVIFAELEYPLRRRPATLSFESPAPGAGGPPSTIGFVTYHRGLPVNDFRYLATRETVDLDWGDPWYSRFRNRNLRRQYDAPLNVFLYIEPYEVRVEVIARPIDVQRWHELELGDRDDIPAGMQAALKADVARFFADQFELSIDGQPVRPELDRIHFLNRTLRTSTVIDPPRDLSLISATLGIIYVQPTTGLPQHVDLDWRRFDDKIARVPVAATDQAGPLPGFLTPDAAVLTWQNFLKNPEVPTFIEIEPPPAGALKLIAWVGWVAALMGAVILVRSLATRAGRERSRASQATIAIGTLVAIVGATLSTGAAHMGDEQADAVVVGVLANVYHAFDFRGEEAIYDTLARSVEGELLTEIYLETRRGLELSGQGGARAKVRDVRVTEVEPGRQSGDGGFRSVCTWEVSGSVGHWGHVHQRTNRYRAELALAPSDGAWKITGIDLLQEERL